MEILTYKDLEARYGKDLAFDLLLSIEKVAKTKDDTIHYDEETRLQKALAALDGQTTGETANTVGMQRAAG